MINKKNTSKQKRGWALVHLMRRAMARSARQGFKRMGKPCLRERMARILRIKPEEVVMSNHKLYNPHCHQANSRRGVIPLEALAEDPLAGRITRVEPGPFVGQLKRAERRSIAKGRGETFQPLLAE